ncbi:hypothetical protein [Asticcacaulis sp. W401b]|uniref:hypothetical protein n=1 Tax=Asticcacaulis sp. W401b TaxID=3388666 RepID=UPI003970AC81
MFETRGFAFEIEIAGETCPCWEVRDFEKSVLAMALYEATIGELRQLHRPQEAACFVRRHLRENTSSLVIRRISRKRWVEAKRRRVAFKRWLKAWRAG